jgi:hypothetical protein
LKTTPIRDGQFQVKIALGSGVRVQDAELIVRSARRSFISDIEVNVWPAIDAQKLTQINASEWVLVIEGPPWSYVRQPGARYFDVIERSGRINMIGLSDGRRERVGSILVDP